MTTTSWNDIKAQRAGALNASKEPAVPGGIEVADDFGPTFAPAFLQSHDPAISRAQTASEFASEDGRLQRAQRGCG